MRHPIQGRTAQSTFDLQISPSSRSQFITDDLLIAGHLRLGQRASMISTFFFPSFSALFSNSSQDLIAGQRRRFAIAVLLNLGIFGQHNQRLDGGLLGWIGQGLKDFLFVVAAIAAARLDLVVDLHQQGGNLRRIIDPIFGQGLGDNLAGGFVGPQGQFAPGAAHRPTVLPHFPLAFPLDF
jgi:hypothetical protein